jgi:hypothetical protein
VPDKQHNDRTQRRTDQSSALIVPIPPNALANERSDESPGDADRHCHYEPLGVIRTRQQKAGDEAGEKAD